jgi:hypothetical protein
MHVHTNPKPAFKTVTSCFPEVEVNVLGAGDYLDKVNIRVCRLKKLMK